MADNLDVTPGTGATIAANEISGVKHQRVKLSLGAAGSAVDAVGGAGANSTAVQRVTIATDDQMSSVVKDALIGDYETVAASSTDQAMGTGAQGDYISHIIIIPASLTPGAVSIKDGAGGDITIFAGGASSVSNLVPFVVPLGMRSTSGAWKITTGANVSAIGVGNFA